MRTYVRACLSPMAHCARPSPLIFSQADARARVRKQGRWRVRACVSCAFHPEFSSPLSLHAALLPPLRAYVPLTHARTYVRRHFGSRRGLGRALRPATWVRVSIRTYRDGAAGAMGEVARVPLQAGASRGHLAILAACWEHMLQNSMQVAHAFGMDFFATHSSCDLGLPGWLQSPLKTFACNPQ